jgi:hypothetical protein
MAPICGARHGRPNLRLVHVSCPVSPFEASISARNRLAMVKPRCALNAASRHNVYYQYWSEALRRNIEAL